MDFEQRHIGSIDIEDGMVDITDPCYDRDTWCRINDAPVKPGKYDCFSVVGDDGWGPRPYRCRIQHESLGGGTVKNFECFGAVAVDAGVCGFFSHKPNYKEDDQWGDVCGRLDAHNKRADVQDDAYRAYLFHKEDAVMRCEAFFTESGMGDGYYEVYAAKKEGEIVALELRFDYDEEDAAEDGGFDCDEG